MHARLAPCVDLDSASKVLQRSYLFNYKCPLDKARISCSFGSRHIHTCSWTIQARTKLWVQLPRSASSALCFADIRSSRFKAAVLLYGQPTSTLRQPAEPPPLHPWLTSFHRYSTWQKARCRSGRRRRRAIQVWVSICTAQIRAVLKESLPTGLQIAQIKQSLEMWGPPRVCAFTSGPNRKSVFTFQFQGKSAREIEHLFPESVHLWVHLQPPDLLGGFWMLCSKCVILKLWKLHSGSFPTF